MRSLILNVLRHLSYYFRFPSQIRDKSNNIRIRLLILHLVDFRFRRNQSNYLRLAGWGTIGRRGGEKGGKKRGKKGEKGGRKGRKKLRRERDKELISTT